jgi:hypothetical protein
MLSKRSTQHPALAMVTTVTCRIILHSLYTVVMEYWIEDVSSYCVAE